MINEWNTAIVSDFKKKRILHVKDGKHGKYRPCPDEFVSSGTAFIREAYMDAGRVLFESATKINEMARSSNY